MILGTAWHQTHIWKHLLWTGPISVIAVLYSISMPWMYMTGLGIIILFLVLLRTSMLMLFPFITLQLLSSTCPSQLSPLPHISCFMLALNCPEVYLNYHVIHPLLNKIMDFILFSALGPYSSTVIVCSLAFSNTIALYLLSTLSFYKTCQIHLQSWSIFSFSVKPTICELACLRRLLFTSCS